MHSSISSSEVILRARQSATGSMAVLLVITTVALVGFELFARFVVERGSKVQRMVNAEYREAIRIHHGTPGQPMQLLIVGNSLVGYGIDFDELKRDLPRNCQAHRFWIYNTTYEDWYFGLRRLFGNGSRPDVLAVVFAAAHWYAPGIRGDYSAQYLFQAKDLAEVQSHLNLTRTAASSLLFAHFSKFFALRSEIRKVLLENLFPDLPLMNTLFKPGSAKQLSDQDVARLITPHLEAFRDLAARYGTRLVLIVPPLRDANQEHQAGIRAAAKQARVTVLIPMSSEDVQSAEFVDELHLNAAGARRFTVALTEQLEPILNR